VLNTGLSVRYPTTLDLALEIARTSRDFFQKRHQHCNDNPTPLVWTKEEVPIIKKAFVIAAV